MQEEIVAAIREAGVVGAGGAGFPTHVKINAKVDMVLANGAECEPLLRAHQHVMAAESDNLVAGLAAVMLATGAGRGYIGLKRKYTEAVANLEAAIGRLGDRRIELFFLPDMYPAGDEQVLVHEVTGRIVPEGGIPLHVGAVVANVETLVNVAKALRGTAVVSKYLTVTGAVAHPVTVQVPVGTSVQAVIALAGGVTTGDYALIDGGPMMGKLVGNDSVVTKTTSGIIVLPARHPLIVQKKTPWSAIINRAKAVCCNCRACTDCCPRHLLGHSLEPHRIMQAIGNGIQDPATLTRALLCSECGACDTFGCTMGLSPRRVNAELKRQLGSQQKEIARLTSLEAKRTGRAVEEVAADEKVRFSSRSVRAQRRRLGLSADEYAKLVGVSPLTIYNWEHGKVRPRDAQLARLVAVRNIGKRDALQRLAELSEAAKAGRKKG